MVKSAAMVFGVVFLLIGVLGFVPGITNMDSDPQLLLGIFAVDALHNIIHIASGVLALVAARSVAYAKTYFQVFGIVYALVTVAGFVQGETVLGLIVTNTADNFLHLVIAAASLYLGFAGGKAAAPAKV